MKRDQATFYKKMTQTANCIEMVAHHQRWPQATRDVEVCAELVR